MMPTLFLAIVASLQTVSAPTPQPGADDYYRRLWAATPGEQRRKAHNDALIPTFKQYQHCVSTSAKRFSSSKESAPVVAQSALQKCRVLRQELKEKYKDTFINKEAFFDVFDENTLAEATMLVVESRSRPAPKSKK